MGARTHRPPCWRAVAAALALAAGPAAAVTCSVPSTSHPTLGADLRVLNTATGGTACRPFADGFASGGTLAWSAHTPL